MIKLGIISLAHPHSIGNHLPALKYLQEHLQVYAIYHDDKDFAQQWIGTFNARYYQTRDELLADPNIQTVLITSKNVHHAADCIAAAEAGKDILCDKPIATSSKDAYRICEAVHKNGVRFFTTFPVRFNTAMLDIKKQIKNGEFGKIHAVMATNHGCMYEPGAPDWVKHNNQNGGGCIVDHTVHAADIIRWLTGSEFATVRAFASKRLHADIEGEDIGVLQGRMNDRTMYQIDTSWTRLAHHPMWGDVTFRIVGEKRSASLDIYNHQRIEVHTDKQSYSLYPNNIVLEHGGIFLDYIRYVEQGAEPICANAEDGAKTVDLVYAAYESIDKNCMIRL